LSPLAGNEPYCQRLSVSRQIPMAAAHRVLNGTVLPLILSHRIQKRIWRKEINMRGQTGIEPIESCKLKGNTFFNQLSAGSMTILSP
jgi:hypothetical protein